MSNEYFAYSPDYSSWEDFNGNLLIAYGYEPLPIHSEENWRQTARALEQMTTFALYPIPNPDTYAKWQDWAKEFALIINGPK
jgi:hypothetical protein